MLKINLQMFKRLCLVCQYLRTYEHIEIRKIPLPFYLTYSFNKVSLFHRNRIFYVALVFSFFGKFDNGMMSYI